MLFQTPVSEIIKARKSIRSYLDKPIAVETQKAFDDFLAANTQGPLKSQARFMSIAAAPQDRETLKGMITYGVIKNPKGFLIGVVDKGHNNLEDFGYLMELNILKATDLGLGTCWLGGTFAQSAFAQKIGLNNNEILPAVSPFGYAVPKLSLKDAAVRVYAGADKRKSWSDLFFSVNLPLSTAEAGKYATALEMIRLAPSANNFQPWRVVKEPGRDVFHFFLKRTFGFKQLLAAKSDIQRVDIGIAMCHFVLTAAEAGLIGQWQIEDPHLAGVTAKWEYVVTWLDTGAGK